VLTALDDPGLKNIWVELDERAHAKAAAAQTQSRDRLQGLIDIFRYATMTETAATAGRSGRKALDDEEELAVLQSLIAQERGRHVFPRPRTGRYFTRRGVRTSARTRRRGIVDQVNQELQELIGRGQAQGYVTYDEVNKFLPEDDFNIDQFEELLLTLKPSELSWSKSRPLRPSSFRKSRRRRQRCRRGRAAAARRGTSGRAGRPGGDPDRDRRSTKLTDDPIRMYLSQMAEIPLLSREEEVALATRIERTRRQFRRSVLACDFAMRKTVDTLKKVYKGECRSIAQSRSR